MEKIYNYYQTTIQAYSRQVDNLKKRIHLFGTIRLLLVAGLIAVIWFLKGYDWMILVGGILLIVIPFIALMVYHNFLSERKSYAEALISLCENELKGLNYDFSAFDGAPDKISGHHSFTLDLDIFGEHSFFQSINRTVTHMGREILASWFIQPLSNKNEILKRQEAIEEISNLTQLRQHFYVTGKLNPGKTNDPDIVTASAQQTPLLANKPFWRMAIWIIPAIWVFLWGGFIMDWIPGFILTMFFFFSLLISNVNAKKIVRIHESVNKMERVFATYSKLIKNIEGDYFKSNLLSGISQQFQTDNESASGSIKRLSRLIGALDQRFSAAGLILNIFLLRDTRKAIEIEEWKQKYGTKTKGWFNALGTFDALSSLGGFAFNHPDYIYPVISETYFELKGKAIGHPLIKRDVCIKNNIDIEKAPWFMIVTGANMAGKSTYLRTVGINFLLSCTGAPVCADEFEVYPAHLVTSLRTTDSLVSNESYFFAELKRLKMIINRLQQGEKLFIILDEILKGTNSVDKQKGSLALIKQLISYDACGIIATHDLILGSLAEEFPDKIRNYRFEADITDNELTFSYQLRDGIAQNMNACFLMQKMGITV